MVDTRVSRSPSAELLDDELERLNQGRRTRTEQRASLRVLDTERDQLERVLDESSYEPDRNVWDRLRQFFSEPPPPIENDVDFDRDLARLGEIERERSQIVSSLSATSDLEERFEHAIARKRAWIASVPGHPAAAELERLSEERSALQRELDVLDHQMYRTADALGHLQRLVDALDDASTLALLDLAIDVQPLDLALAGAKHTRVARARGLAEQAVQSLKALHGDLAKQLESELPAGDLAWIDAATSGAIGGFVDAYVSGRFSRWQNAARDCLDRLKSLDARLKSRRRPLEQRSSELTKLYQELVLQA